MAHFGPQRHRKKKKTKYETLFLKYVPIETKISWQVTECIPAPILNVLMSMYAMNVDSMSR
jgi:hypothetical protein